MHTAFIRHPAKKKKMNRDNRGSSLVSQLVSVAPIHQSCGFYPQSGHIQESTNEHKNKWNNKSLFLFLNLSLSQINLKKDGDNRDNNNAYFCGVLRGLNELIPTKLLDQWLAHVNLFSSISVIIICFLL